VDAAVRRVLWCGVTCHPADAGDEQCPRCGCSSLSCTVVWCYLPPGRCWPRAMSEVWMQQSVVYCGALCCRGRRAAVRTIQYNNTYRFIMPTVGGSKRYRLSVPWRSGLGCRHAGCLQHSHRRPPEMRGLRIRPWTDVDPPRVELPSAGGISSRRPRGDT